MQREERDLPFKYHAKGFFRGLFRCSKKDVDAVFQNKPFSSKVFGFSFFSIPGQESLPGRFFVIISRKVAKASKRNLLRRRLKAIFFQDKLFLKNYTTLLVCYKGAAETPFPKLKQLVLSHFERAVARSS